MTWPHGNLLMYANIATNAFSVTCSKVPKKPHEITKVGIDILFYLFWQHISCWMYILSPLVFIRAPISMRRIQEEISGFRTW